MDEPGREDPLGHLQAHVRDAGSRTRGRVELAHVVADDVGPQLRDLRPRADARRPVLAGDAVQASRLLGFGSLYVLRQHLLPALAPVLTTLLAFSVAQAVLALAALG